jgi:hypothetical protein
VKISGVTKEGSKVLTGLNVEDRLAESVVVAVRQALSESGDLLALGLLPELAVGTRSGLDVAVDGERATARAGRENSLASIVGALATGWLGSSSGGLGGGGSPALGGGGSSGSGSVVWT